MPDETRSFDPSTPASARPRTRQRSGRRAVSDDAVPEGTVRVVNDWISRRGADSVARATSALAAENASDKPRAGVIDYATRILDAAESGDGDQS